MRRADRSDASGDAASVRGSLRLRAWLSRSLTAFSPGGFARAPARSPSPVRRSDDCWATTKRDASNNTYAELDHFPCVGTAQLRRMHARCFPCARAHLTRPATFRPRRSNGMKPVVDYVHSKGLSFGLYTCGGTQTCVGGRVGSMGFWTEDANSYASWGVDWVKMDWRVARVHARARATCTLACSHARAACAC